MLFPPIAFPDEVIQRAWDHFGDGSYVELGQCFKEPERPFPPTLHLVDEK